MQIAVLTLLAAAGCDRVLQLGDIRPGRDGGNAEGSSVDASVVDGNPAPPSCTSFAISDDFTDAIACSSWGSAYADPGGSVTDGGGMLLLEPAKTALAVAGCASNAVLTLSAGGMYAWLATPLSGTDTHSTIKATGNPGYSLGVSNGRLVFGDQNLNATFAYATYDSTAMAWIRLRYDASAGGVAADYSADGATWWNLAVMPASLPAAAPIGIEAGVGSVLTFGGPAQFAHFRFCTP